MSIRLVLADDHTMLRDGLRRSLEDEGFEVLGEASDGLEAVDLAARLQPDVVLMDVTMPHCDGVEATRRIRAAQPEVRVVMLTMHADREVLQAALAAGAAGYLVKDCSIDEIAETVRMAVDDESNVSPAIAASMLAEVRRLDDTAGGGRADGAPDDQLVTKREVEVLQLIADGCSTTEVAERLFISQKTVKNHLASIYQKLDARDRTQAVLQAVRKGIVRLG
ncbi:MAG TPA: response regulator transcription factor [Acidimicrobiales bacterium]|nr:response regulator transcription factor [Acidimicrobiales bacterium]